jgi:hypothetical protein
MDPPFNCLYLNTKSRLYSETTQRSSCLREAEAPSLESYHWWVKKMSKLNYPLR